MLYYLFIGVFWCIWYILYSQNIYFRYMLYNFESEILGLSHKGYFSFFVSLHMNYFSYLLEKEAQMEMHILLRYAGPKGHFKSNLLCSVFQGRILVLIPMSKMLNKLSAPWGLMRLKVLVFKIWTGLVV